MLLERELLLDHRQARAAPEVARRVQRGRDARHLRAVVEVAPQQQRVVRRLGAARER